MVEFVESRNRGQTDASSGIYLPWRDVILISIDALILVVVYLAIGSGILRKLSVLVGAVCVGIRMSFLGKGFSYVKGLWSSSERSDTGEAGKVKEFMHQGEIHNFPEIAERFRRVPRARQNISWDVCTWIYSPGVLSRWQPASSKSDPHVHCRENKRTVYRGKKSKEK